MAPSPKSGLDGPTIRRLRHERGWTQQELVEEIRDAALDLGQSKPGVTAQQISRWENGNRAPSRTNHRLVEHAFARTMTYDSQSWEDEMHRRAFLRSSTTAAGFALVTAAMGSDPIQRLSAALLRPSTVDLTTVGHLQTLTTTFSNLYQTVAPATLVDPVRSHLNTLAKLLNNGSQATHIRKHIASLASESAILMGWITHDIGDHGSAQQYYMTAIEAAVEGEDNAVGAYALASASTLPAFRSSPGQTIHLLTEAEIRGVRADHATATTLSWINALQAEAYTREHDTKNAFAALDRATDLLDQVGPHDEPRPRVPFFDSVRLLGERGITSVRLDMPAEGQAALDTALTDLPPDRKIHSRLLTSLAKAHLRQGRLEQACDTALQSLDVATRTNTQPDIADLQSFRRHDLKPWNDSELVRDLDAALSAASATLD